MDHNETTTKLLSLHLEGDMEKTEKKKGGDGNAKRGELLMGHAREKRKSHESPYEVGVLEG